MTRLNLLLPPNCERTKGEARGFTLVEFLVVTTVIALLAALLLPALSRGKSQGRRTQCASTLRQVGIAFRMYLDDHRFFPDYYGEPGSFWADRLAPYSKMAWTNRASHCPEYKGHLATGFVAWGSYSYNVNGTGGLELGLGGAPHPDPRRAEWVLVSEPQVIVPSDLFEVADARMAGFTQGPGCNFETTEAKPNVYMMSWVRIVPEPQPLRHGNGFNFLFCDGHVALVKRDYFDNPTNSWISWNKDHREHRDTWR